LNLEKILLFFIAATLCSGFLLWIWLGEWRWFVTGIVVAFVISVVTSFTGTSKKNDKSR
jgi:uncharacterized membrane protein YjjP (DUF1212 family)